MGIIGSTAIALCSGCTQDRSQGPREKPWLACPILPARLLLLGSLAQDNVQCSKVSLPGATAAPCPGLQARPSTSSSSPCQPCALGSCGVEAPCACPTAAGGAQCPTAACLVHTGCPPLHKHTQTVAQDKVHLGKCKPSPAAVSPGMGQHVQQCPPNHSLAWLGYACVMGQF